MSKKKITTKERVSDAQKIGIGVGLTAAAVAAAGAYFLYGADDAQKNRKKIKSGILRAKAEVLEALEDAYEMTEEEFHTLVDNVANTYSAVQSLSKADLKNFKTDMVGHWRDLLKSGAVKIMTVEQIAKKAAKRKVTKKVVKTSPKVVKKVTRKSATRKTVKKAPTKKKASTKK